MDPLNNFISPKPKKSSSGIRNLNLRSSIQSKRSIQSDCVFDKCSNELVKTKSYTQERECFDFDRSENADSCIRTPFGSFNEPSNKGNELKFNFFSDLEREINENNCQDEILTILSDSCSRKSGDSQEEQSNFTFCPFNQQPARIPTMIGNRPENPFFKNFSSEY